MAFGWWRDRKRWQKVALGVLGVLVVAAAIDVSNDDDPLQVTDDPTAAPGSSEAGPSHPPTPERSGTAPTAPEPATAAPPSPDAPAAPSETVEVRYHVVNDASRRAFVTIASNPIIDASGMVCPRSDIVLPPGGAGSATCTLPVREDGLLYVGAGWYLTETATTEEAGHAKHYPVDADGEMAFLITVREGGITVEPQA